MSSSRIRDWFKLQEKQRTNRAGTREQHISCGTHRGSLVPVSHSRRSWDGSSLLRKGQSGGRHNSSNTLRQWNLNANEDMYTWFHMSFKFSHQPDKTRVIRPEPKCTKELQDPSWNKERNNKGPERTLCVHKWAILKMKWTPGISRWVQATRGERGRSREQTKYLQLQISTTAFLLRRG